MSIENFCRENEKFVKHHAKKLLRKGGVIFDDLYQEGMLSLVILYNSKKLGSVPEEKRNSYINITIRRGLLKYISQMTGTIAVSHNKFFEKNFVPLEYKNLDTQTDETNIPQDEAIIRMEHQFFLNNSILNVVSKFSEKELFVWNTIIMAEKPLTTKQAADTLGYKSNSSISYLKKKIINKIKEGV